MLWRDVLPPDVVRLGDDLADKAQARRASTTVCPPQDRIFRALQLCPPDRVKVVIIGQDPYHTPGQADGLCFSCAQGKPQPSLMNILDELSADLGVENPLGGSTDLSGWARQGVLLLNTSLTVDAHSPNSHADWGWRGFSRAVLECAIGMERPIVVMLWGGNARSLLSEINPDPVALRRTLVLESSHPSPFSCYKATANAPAFMGSHPFSRANKWLAEQGVQPVDWLAGPT